MSFLRKLLGNGIRPAREIVLLCEKLLAERSEYTSTPLAGQALTAYAALDERGREEFFDILAREYSPSPDAVGAAAAAYQADPSPEKLIELQSVIEPRRQELFRRLNMAPGGTAALMAMRRYLLEKSNPAWRAIDADLKHLLRSWFNRGFLRLERIDWRTSALVLEQIIEYEAVHAIQGWRDLRRRLAADRRCFAFFHPQLPDQPIIFIEVALTRGMSAHVQPLIDVRAPVGAPEGADCAMFYSITNCQEALRGISFGNLLIKQVAEELKREFPHLRRFATLSPIPGFRQWLDKNCDAPTLARIADPAWHLGDVPDELRLKLMRLCAYYLVHSKQPAGSEAQRQEPLDAVARFHLGNGAAMERLNWMGDTSETGIARSAGIMVNYVYWLPEVERNHERYFREHHVAASPAVEKLARECPLAREHLGRNTGQAG
ncbi:MAG TPA: malonyl-CoA decarboxylase family protein [Burkholderiales bacterium]|nr:malonyl-CoA decarboxylase family protein [Burkholderiales bacterium]